jgi:hypothetical protein
LSQKQKPETRNQNGTAGSGSSGFWLLIPRFFPVPYIRISTARFHALPITPLCRSGFWFSSAPSRASDHADPPFWFLVSGFPSALCLLPSAFTPAGNSFPSLAVVRGEAAFSGTLSSRFGRGRAI